MHPVGRAGAEGAGPTRELLAISEQARGRWGKPPIGVSHSAHLAEHRADLWKVLALLSSSAQRLRGCQHLEPSAHSLTWNEQDPPHHP